MFLRSCVLKFAFCTLLFASLESFACFAVPASFTMSASFSEPLPARLAGAWRITRLLPSGNSEACWSEQQAQPLVGTILVYSGSSLRWRGGAVPLEGIVTRTVTAEDFRRENATLGTPPDWASLGIHAPSVLEVDLQHADADVTGATTEVPGDSVLLVAPGRIIVSACGRYFEAKKTGAPVPRARRSQ